MYRLDWIEQLKLRTTPAPTSRHVTSVSPIVWKLGFTSLLTDISAEMVNSALPVYLVLHLHISPIQYGAVDAAYNGVALVLLSLAGGLLADRTNRQKEVAAAGYGISAICKLLLLAAGGAWGWITAITLFDRTGKGVRTAPRDALISIYTPRALLGSAFGVHRALDAGGSLLGPIIAFALLSRLPGAFDIVWVGSFAFAVLGVAVLWLFVPSTQTRVICPPRTVSVRSAGALLLLPRFRTLAGCGVLLSVVTISDGFLYLLLQQKSDSALSFFPLFYVLTACSYMLFSIPLGRCADYFGRAPIFLSGYAVLAIVYGVLLSTPSVGVLTKLICLCLLGIYYAGTEGVLMAMASAVIPLELRTSGLAVLATFVGIAKTVSSLLYGWSWQVFGAQMSLILFALGLLIALLISGLWLRATGHAEFKS
jgi:MFS family permease